jgi:superfamily II DNA or RNA helicase
MSPKRLHSYQEECVETLFSAAIEDDAENKVRRELIIIAPTGSGKSIMVGSLLGLLMNDGRSSICSAIIACPQIQIKNSFDVDDELVETSKGQIILSDVRDREHAFKDLFYEWLISSSTPNKLPITWLCCHATLSLNSSFLEEEFEKSGNSSIFRHLAIVVDEFHHAGESSNLDNFLKVFKRGGGLVIKVSATPDRHDGRETLPAENEYVAYTRAMSEHMIEGFAPRSFNSHIIEVKKSDDDGSDSDEEDYCIPGQDLIRSMAIQMKDAYFQSGRPKTLIQLRAKSVDWNRTAISEIIRAFIESGVDGDRIYDATSVLDDSNTKAKDFSAVLDRERNFAEGDGYNFSRYDIIIGIRRVVEGTDWPLCSNIFRAGMPVSLPFFRQLIGRAFRNKKNIKDYPEEWKDKTCVTMFVAGLKKKGEIHSKQTLLTSVFLSSIQLSTEYWTLFRQVYRVIEKFPDVDGPGRPKITEKEKLCFSDEWVEARILVNEVYGLIFESEYSQKNLKSLVEASREAAIGTGLPENLILQACHERYGEENPEYSKKFEEKLGQIVEEKSGDLTATDIYGCIESVLEDFKSETLREVKSKYFHQYHELNGERIEEYSKRVSIALDLKKLREEIKKYRGQNGGKWPEDLSEPPWVDFDRAMKQGTRGMKKLRGGLAEYWSNQYHQRFAELHSIRSGKTEAGWVDSFPCPDNSPTGIYFKHAYRLLREDKGFVSNILGGDLILSNRIGKIRPLRKLQDVICDITRNAPIIGLEEAIEKACLE